MTYGWVAPFIERVTELTNGQVQIEHYPANTLLTGPEMLQGLKMGIADLGFIVPDYTCDLLPLSCGASALPYMWDSTEEGTWVYNQLAEGGLLTDEYARYDVVRLSLIFCGWRPIWLTKEVKTLDELRGLKLRSFGSESPVLDAMGVSCVFIGGGEAKEGMRTGVVDGMSQPYWVVRGYGLTEIAKFGLYIGPHVVPVNLIAINGKVWRELPSDIRDAMYEAGRLSTEAWPETMAQLDKEGEDAMAAAGVVVHKLSPEDIARAKELTAPVIDEWVETHGKDAETLLQQINILKRVYAEQHK